MRRPLALLAAVLVALPAAAQDLPERRARYGEARDLARAGEPDRAGEALIDAIALGFTDFFAMERDRALAPIRSTDAYQTILLGWRDLLDARGETDAASAREALGKAYRVVRDDDLRIHIVHAHRDEAVADALADLRAVARWWDEVILGALPDGLRRRDPGRPDPWVTLVLPTPEDFVRLIGRGAASGGVGGVYDPDINRLIAQDLGPTLRHEFVHALDWRLLRRVGASRPVWMQEAVASLVEDVDLGPDGALRPVPSWRTNIAKRRVGLALREGWARLFETPRDKFVGVRPNAQYAEARAIALFMLERGALGAWVSGALEDDGAEALAASLGVTLDEAEGAFVAWLRDLPEAPEAIEPGTATLGVDLARGRGDGARIEAIRAGAGARRAGLRAGDVLVRVGGLRVWTPEDLARVLASRRPGETVEVEVRRYARRLTVQATLDPAR